MNSIRKRTCVTLLVLFFTLQFPNDGPSTYRTTYTRKKPPIPSHSLKAINPCLFNRANTRLHFFSRRRKPNVVAALTSQYTANVLWPHFSAALLCTHRGTCNSILSCSTRYINVRSRCKVSVRGSRVSSFAHLIELKSLCF